MGLFERLRSMLAADETEQPDTAAEPSGDRSPEEASGSATGTSTGSSMQTHGSHWDTIVPEDGRSEAIQNLMMTTISEGEIIEGKTRDGTAVTGHRHKDGPLGTLAVSVGHEAVTSYPIVDGVQHTIDVTGLNEWETGIEAWLIATLADAELGTFATNYFASPSDRFGGECAVSIGLLMYDFAVVDEETDTAPAELADDFAGFRPLEGGAPDDYVVRTTVEAVDVVAHEKFEARRIEAPLFRPSEGESIDVALYVGDHLLDSEPRPGDSIEGACWMQSWFH